MPIALRAPAAPTSQSGELAHEQAQPLGEVRVAATQPGVGEDSQRAGQRLARGSDGADGSSGSVEKRPERHERAPESCE